MKEEEICTATQIRGSDRDEARKDGEWLGGGDPALATVTCRLITG